MLKLKLRGLEGRIRKGACDAFSRPGERMERPSGQGGAQPSSEMSGESHYPLQQKYPPEWGIFLLELKLRGLEGRIRKGACDAFSRPGERMERPSGQGGAQPSSEMSGESHYPLQQEHPPIWEDVYLI